MSAINYEDLSRNDPKRRTAKDWNKFPASVFPLKLKTRVKRLLKAKELLKKWRENSERRSFDVLMLWQSVLENDLHKLGCEKHVILEQVIFAALDCHYYGLPYHCISVLEEEFPNSLRVMKLKAAHFEATEKYSAARDILDSVIAVDETNAPARKRQIAILKALGQIPDAVKELVSYLKKFIGDVEGWLELSELYLQLQEYPAAAFCIEELLLHQPHNHLLYQRLADIRYTMGGVENMETAKTYYCQALKLNPKNIRALLGLFLACNNLVSHYKSSGSAKRKEAWRLARWAQSRVAALPRAANAPVPLADMMLALAITE